MIAMSDVKEPKDENEEVDALLESVEEDKDAADPGKEPPSKSEMILQVASVIPLHQIAGEHVKRRPGRPRKVISQPSTSDLVYHAKMAEQQTKHVENDALVRATKDRNKDSMEMLQLAKERYTRILAALEFRRVEDEKTGGKDSAQILSREAAVLRDIVALETRINEMGIGMIDLHGEPMQKVFRMFVGKIREVAQGILAKEQFDLFFNNLETSLDGWEEEADALLR